MLKSIYTTYMSFHTCSCMFFILALYNKKKNMLGKDVSNQCELTLKCETLKQAVCQSITFAHLENELINQVASSYLTNNGSLFLIQLIWKQIKLC